jgi:EmrB/QacA subfamily drug resistance transporter
MTIGVHPLRVSPTSRSDSYPRRWLALAVLCVSLLIVNLDTTVLNVALPTLVRDLHATDSQLQWIVDSYVIVFAGLLLVLGSLADRLGRKRVFLAGLAAFAAGSAWAAFSGSVGVLTAARSSMGIGAAMMMPSALSIITDCFRDAGERQRAIGFWAATSGAGIALGPIVSGLLLARFWWGSVFLINVPIAVAGLVLALPLVPDSKNSSAERPDFAGALLSIAGLGLLLWAIIEAPGHGWTSALVTGTGLGGLAILVLFTVWERASSHPMLDLSFFRDRWFSGAVASVGMVTFGLLGALFVLTQYLQFELGYTALQAGVRMIPAAAAIVIVAPVSALAVRLTGSRITLAGGLIMIAGGLWWMSAASVTTTYVEMLPGVFLLGIGAGLAMPCATALVMGSLPQEHTGVGSATNGTFLQLGGALGVAVIGSLLSSHYQGNVSSALAGVHIPAAALHTILGSLGGALAVAAQVGGPLRAALAHVARSAFISGMDLGLRTGAAVGAAGGLLALAVLPSRPRRSSSLARENVTQQSP